jgi:Arc/MetJ-type ribon-helix-helix transcriptional regulator
LERHIEAIYLGVFMQGTEKQEPRDGTSAYLPERYRKMAEVLVSSGHYRNRSEVVRAGIERIFNDKFKDSNIKEELKREKEKLEKITKKLEELVSTNEDVQESLIGRYVDRKRNMPPKAMGNYETFSKNWLIKNFDEASLAFPGRNVDEIYTELEKIIKK